MVYSKEDHEMIVSIWDRLKETIQYDKLDPEDRAMIQKAYDLGYHAHHKQRRKSGEPYFIHPLEVAIIAKKEIGLGPTAIACAILHDVVEDTPVTQEEVEEMFGSKVGQIVDGLTKLDGMYNVESPQAANFKKVLSTLLDDVRVVLIKMADRLHNLRTISSMPQHKQLKIAAETSYIYAPLAHRLGLYNIRTEFQDICMKITEPSNYQFVKNKLKESKDERRAYIDSFVRPLKKELDEMGLTYEVTGRAKSISSIWNKIKTKKVTFEEIYDLFAIRIIVDVERKKEKAACWQVYSIVTDVYRPIPERLKDWITTPKSNGYESLHTTVIGPEGRYVEVQIRTSRMNEIAEKGFAAHWKYKGVNNQHDSFENWFDSIRDLLDNANADAIEFVTDFKTSLFREEVYAYTPKGDMIVLPKGATALDFAFAIHSDVGYRATAIKVNNKLVPMGQKLKSGDQVSVTTSRQQKPSESWLKMVVTGKARSKIRSAMKEERRKRGEFGMEALMRKLKNLKVDYEEGVDTLVKHLKLKSRPDLYYKIAQEELILNDVLKQFDVEHGKLLPRKLQQEETKEEVTLKEEPRSKVQPTPINNLLINGEPADTYKHTLATCCNPVQGDRVFAYLTANQEIKIHRVTCPNATHMIANYGYRVLKAEWSTATNSNFVVDLQIIGVDDGPGVIQRMTQTISNDLGLNIRSFSIEGKEGFFMGKVSLVVKNSDQLFIAIQKLTKIKGVTNVVRL